VRESEGVSTNTHHHHHQQHQQQPSHGAEAGRRAATQVWEGIRQQNELTAQLCFIVGDIAQVRGNARKVERLREILNQPAAHGFTDLSTFQSMPLPLDPCVQVSVAHTFRRATFLRHVFEPGTK